MAKQADLGNRVVAIIIDHVILAVILLIIAIPLGISAMAFSFMSGMTTFNFGHMMPFFGSMMFINALLFLVYFTYFEGTTGQTPGKRVMGIKVAKENGKRPNTADALIRTIFRIVDSIGFYILGFVVILLTEKHQRLGDLAAKTVVVKA